MSIQARFDETLEGIHDTWTGNVIPTSPPSSRASDVLGMMRLNAVALYRAATLIKESRDVPWPTVAHEAQMLEAADIITRMAMEWRRVRQ